MNRLSANVRYLLFKAQRDRSLWAGLLAKWLQCDEWRADLLLQESNLELNPNEVRRIARVCGIDAKKLQSSNLVELDAVDVLAQNIGYLLDSLPHGRQQQVAATLGVDVATVSRWRSGTQRAAKTKLRRIREYFGLPPDTDLATEPVFLLTRPVGRDRMKEWLHSQIDNIDPLALRELFPALMRLLRTRRGY